MRGKTIIAKEPRGVLLLAQEIDGHVGTPSGLAEFSGDAVLDIRRGRSVIEFLPACALCGEPLGIGVLGPIGLWMVGPVKDLVAIINPFFHYAIGTGRQMQFAGEPTGVSGIGQ